MPAPFLVQIQQHAAALARRSAASPLRAARRSRSAPNGRRRRSGTSSARGPARPRRRRCRRTPARRAFPCRSGSRSRGCGTRRARSAARPRRPSCTSHSVRIRYRIRSAIVIISSSCFFANLRQLRHARHRAVLVHDFADHAGRIRARRCAPGRPPPRSGRRAPARRRRARAAETCGRAAPDPTAWSSGSIAASTVAARSAAEMPVLVPRLRFDRHAERGFERASCSCVDHQRNLELVEPLAGHRQADQAAAVRRHEVDRLGRHLLGGDRQVAFVLAILVVDDDDHLAAADRGDRVLDRRERARERAPLAILSLCLSWSLTAHLQLHRADHVLADHVALEVDPVALRAGA